ncbi:hypothetical protein QYF36_016976 [Acer negundo]|nr:hypothetical protein QYF36_016976 [Acer negundo]
MPYSSLEHLWNANQCFESQDESKEKTNGWFGADMEEEEEDPFSRDPKRCMLSALFEDGTLMEGEQMQRSETELPETVSGGDIRFQVLKTSDQHSGRVGSSEEQRLGGLEATVQALAAQLNNTTIREYDVSHSNLPPEDQVASFQCVEKKRKLIPTIEVFLKLVEKSARVDINTSIEVSHEEDTFGNLCFTIITLEDCHIIISMTELTVSCINVYIRILYDQLKNNGILGQFGFINPASVSVVGGVLDNAIRRDERAHEIASSLQRATQAQLIFMPYNLGFHWILVVIDMLSMTIYYLDSLRGILRNDLKNIVQKIYHSQNSNSRGGQVNMPWKTIQVPRQPGSVDCGYYVLRFMKDIIADPSLLTRNFHGKDRYSKEEIDEVRCEWIAFVSNLM